MKYLGHPYKLAKPNARGPARKPLPSGFQLSCGTFETGFARISFAREALAIVISNRGFAGEQSVITAAGFRVVGFSRLVAENWAGSSFHIMSNFFGTSFDIATDFFRAFND